MTSSEKREELHKRGFDILRRLYNQQLFRAETETRARRYVSAQELDKLNEEVGDLISEYNSLRWEEA